MRIRHGDTMFVFEVPRGVRRAARSVYRVRRESDRRWPTWQPIGGVPQQRRAAGDEAAAMVLALLVDLDLLPGGRRLEPVAAVPAADRGVAAGPAAAVTPSFSTFGAVS